MSTIIVKNIIAVILALSAVISLIFGVYAPVAKSRAYIGALRTISSVNSIEGFRAHFTPALSHWSPIGQEEAVKFLANDIMSIASQPEQPEAVARAVADFIEPYLFKDNVRHLLIGGGLHTILWQNYGRQETDFEKAEAYYRVASTIGPTLPPPLYALLDLYRQKGDVENTSAVASQILTLWPDDENVKALTR